MSASVNQGHSHLNVFVDVKADNILIDAAQPDDIQKRLAATDSQPFVQAPLPHHYKPEHSSSDKEGYTFNLTDFSNG